MINFKMIVTNKNIKRRIKSILQYRIRRVDGLDYLKYNKNAPSINPLNKKEKVLHSVFLHVPSGTLYDKKLGILSRSKIGKSQIKRCGLIGEKKPSLNKVTKIKKGTSFYCNSASGGFYHWLVECIPRYYFIDKSVQCYLPKLNNLNREILNTIYDETHNINEVDDEWLFFEEFITARYFALPGRGFLPLEFRKHILKIVPNNIYNDKVVFISRSNAPKRKLLNEAELINKVLSKHSALIVHLENYKFLEQLKIINNSRIVIATHGAGLSNIIAAPKNCKILEILSTNVKPMNFYKDLSTSIGLNYSSYLIRQPVGRNDDFNFTEEDLNFIDAFISDNKL